MIKSGVITWSGGVLLPQHPDPLGLGKQRLLIPSELSVCPGSRDEQAEPPVPCRERNPKHHQSTGRGLGVFLLLQEELCPPGISRAPCQTGGMRVPEQTLE